MKNSYTKLMLGNCPRIAYAHIYQSQHYHVEMPVTEGVVELLWTETGESRRLYGDGRTVELPEHSLAFSTHSEPYLVYSDAPVHRHLAVGFWVDYTRHELTAGQVALCARASYQRPDHEEPPRVLLTECLEELSCNCTVVELMRRLIQTHSVPETTRELKCLSLLFKLLSEISEETVRRAASGEKHPLPRNSAAYVHEAIRYIFEHLEQHIGVEELSAYLGLSSGYLCGIFKRVTGQRIIEYVNRLKLSRVRDLIATWGMSLREAGGMVGIADENYLSRLFKQMYGQSVREFRMTCTNKTSG